MKIRIARALAICPRRILGSADSIRSARNKIAHELAFNAYDELPVGTRDSINARRKEYYNPQNDAPVEEGLGQFIALAVFTTTALLVYANHARHLRTTIDDEQFVPAVLAQMHPPARGAD